MSHARIRTLLEHAQLLKRVPRMGWLLQGVNPAESVADHTAATALLVMALAAEINRDPGAHGLTAPLNAGRAAQIALLHDLAESVLTDLPKRAGDLVGATVKHDAEAVVALSLLHEFDSSQELLALWHEYAEGTSPEGRLVKDADKLEMVAQALAYERAGNRSLDEFFEGFVWHFALSANLFEGLRQSR